MLYVLVTCSTSPGITLESLKHGVRLEGDARPVGIITLEDIIEEIVGEITDEFDDEELIYSKLDDKNYVFEGKTALIDMYRVLDIDGENFEKAKGDSDSIAGFILELAGKIPLKNERVKFENYLFTIEAADKRRVKRIKVTILD